MALDTSREALDKRINTLRSGYEGYSGRLRTRNRAYLRLYSPEFNEQLGEHDQWPDDFKAQNVGHARSSYNITRSVVELWTALEAYPFPGIKWMEDKVPPPVPSTDEQEHAQRVQTARAMSLVATQIATMRENAVNKAHRLGRLDRHYYRWVLRKNLFGHGWLSAIPDLTRKKFNYKSTFDPSTVYPVWAAWDQNELSAILCVSRQRARSIAEQYPDAVDLGDDGEVVMGSPWYNPTSPGRTDFDRNWVWVEDFWILDRTWASSDRNEPQTSRVINALRVNGKVVEDQEYKGWKTIPYFHNENDNLRDRLGFSDAAMVAPIQDALNRMLSQQQDVIAGESRPKFKFRSESDRDIVLSDEGIIHLDPDEDIDQISVNIQTYPTQIHGQQLMEILARGTGLNDSVYGRIVASANSGRALATAWRSVASRLVPRLQSDADALDKLVNFELDIMEQYDWDSAKDLYNGNRDFAPDFPNQEPRDFMEVAQVAVTKQNAGLIDNRGAMEETGEQSPDEMQERVRGDYVDPVLHPEKAQSYILLAREKQQMALEAQAAQVQAQNAQQAAANTPPGGAPGGANMAQTRSAAEQARTQAAQQAAPQQGPGTPAPGTQPGQPGNATRPPLQISTLVQNGGPAQNRIISQQ